MSMTVSDRIIERNATMPRAMDTPNPGRPIEQKMDTEKYLERERERESDQNRYTHVLWACSELTL